MAVDAVTPGEWRALRIAAHHTRRTPKAERVERHRDGRQYARELFDAGLLMMARVNGRPPTLELSPAGVAVLDAVWRGEIVPGPKCRHCT